MRNELKRKSEIMRQYLDLCAEQQELVHHYQEFLAKMEGINAVVLTDMPKGSSQYDKMAGNMARLEQLQHLIADRTAGLLEAKEMIEIAIASLEKASHRRILTMRYVEGMKWELICVRLHYQWAQIHRAHAQALTIINL